MWVNDVRMWSAAHAWQRTGRLLAVVFLSFHYQREWEKRIHCSQGIMNIDSSLYPWTNIFIMAIDSGHSVILVLVPVLDSSATFDTVDHGILLTWLSIHFGFGSIVVQWLIVLSSWSYSLCESQWHVIPFVKTYTGSSAGVHYFILYIHHL